MTDRKAKRAPRRNLAGMAPAGTAAAGMAPAGLAPADMAAADMAPADTAADDTVAAVGDTATAVLAPSRPAQPGVRPQPSKKKGARKPRILSNRTLALAGASTVMAGAAFLILTRSTPDGVTQTHVLTTPTDLGCYVKQPQLAVQMQAKTLQQQIVRQSSGAAKNVIYAVYENTACGGASMSDPQVFLFIGGNLSGTSASSFISGFTGKLPGATMTSPGSLGGDAACVPSVQGHPAECAWADNDTFGAVASATMNASSLAKEMRQMRPLIEQATHSARPGRHSRSTGPSQPAAKAQPSKPAASSPQPSKPAPSSSPAK